MALGAFFPPVFGRFGPTKRANGCLVLSERKRAGQAGTAEIHPPFALLSDVTILLSLTVFLNTVSESMPATSDAVPLISKQKTELKKKEFAQKSNSNLAISAGS